MVRTQEGASLQPTPTLPHSADKFAPSGVPLSSQKSVTECCAHTTRTSKSFLQRSTTAWPQTEEFFNSWRRSVAMSSQKRNGGRSRARWAPKLSAVIWGHEGPPGPGFSPGCARTHRGRGPLRLCHLPPVRAKALHSEITL